MWHRFFLQKIFLFVACFSLDAHFQCASVVSIFCWTQRDSTAITFFDINFRTFVNSLTYSVCVLVKEIFVWNFACFLCATFFKILFSLKSENWIATTKIAEQIFLSQFFFCLFGLYTHLVWTVLFSPFLTLEETSFDESTWKKLSERKFAIFLVRDRIKQKTKHTKYREKRRKSDIWSVYQTVKGAFFEAYSISNVERVNKKFLSRWKLLLIFDESRCFSIHIIEYNPHTWT